MAVLKKVTLFYPALATPNQMSDKYQVNIGGLTDEHIKALKEMGVDASQIKEPQKFDDPKKQEIADAQGKFIVARSEFPVKVVNGKKKDIDETVIKTIGNGSVANVQLNSYDWTFKGKQGTSAGLQQVMLLKHVKYEGFADEFDQEEDELEADGFDEDTLDELEEDELD